MKENEKKKGAFGSELARRLAEGPLYNIGIAAYGAGVRVASLRNSKARLMVEGHKEVWRRLSSSLRADRGYVWIHAASLGEFEQGRPLIERLKRERPELGIVLSFFSPSGFEVRKDYPLADVVLYLPFDTPGNARRFVETVHPVMAIFVKYEFWRNYLIALRNQGVPTYLISGIFQPGQPFFKKWGAWYRGWLSMFSRMYVQDEGSRRLLESAGFDRVTVAGDTRFDRVADIRDSARRIKELDRFAGWKGEKPHDVPVLMVGSSWPADEDIYIPWVNSHKDVKVVIAPHEFDAPRLEKLRGRFDCKVVMMSEAKETPELLEEARVLVIDCFGLLSSAYAYADVAYVGGGFGAGIHNINEAAAHGIPVMFGPNHNRFLEASDLMTLGAGMEVRGGESFSHHAARLLYDRAEREKRGRWADEYIREKCGATGIIFSDLFQNPSSSTV